MASTAVAMGAWALSLTTQVTTLTASAAATAFQNRNAVSKAVLKTKAKAKLRTAIVMLPFAGFLAAAAFERQDFLEWKEENPDGSFEDYACEVGRSSAEIIDEVLQEIPEKVRPGKSMVLDRLPTCQSEDRT